MTKKDSMQKFGVGCFNFRAKKSVPFTFNLTEHVKDLEKSLSKLSSLSNLSIHYEKSFDHEQEVIEEIPALRDGYCFPSLPFGYVRFSLYIPRRVQDELGMLGHSLTGTEHFNVYIVYAYYGPVAFIECVDADSECAPSDAVVVVREYLSREFKKIEDMDFECIGPSPFHADFFVSQNEGIDEIAVNTIPQSGYDRIEIRAPSDMERREALLYVFDEIKGELDEFYHLNRERVIQMNRWEALEEQWSSLRSQLQKPINFFDIRRKILIHKSAQRIITDTYTFAALHLIAKQGAEESFRLTYGKGLASYFQDRVKTELKDAFSEYPTQALIDWAKHVHDSSFKAAELGTVFMSALLGGVIGALVTGFFTVGHPNSSIPEKAPASEISFSR